VHRCALYVPAHMTHQHNCVPRQFRRTHLSFKLAKNERLSPTVLLAYIHTRVQYKDGFQKQFEIICFKFDNDNRRIFF